jgi:hypothetical protein
MKYIFFIILLIFLIIFNLTIKLDYKIILNWLILDI